MKMPAGMVKPRPEQSRETPVEQPKEMTLAEKVQSFDISDVSRFVQRRGVLGGARAAAGAFTAGMGVANPLSALGTILIGRGITQFLTSYAYSNLLA